MHILGVCRFRILVSAKSHINHRVSFFLLCTYICPRLCSFEAESFNKCSFKLGAWYSLGAAIIYLLLAIIAPIVPVSPYEERRGCCYVKGSPPRKGETPTRSNSIGEEEPATKTGPYVEAMEDYESAPGDFTDDDERTTNTNNAESTTVTEDEEAEKEEGGLCGATHCFDDICGKKEEGTEVKPIKHGDE
jgi:hypothetical protein